LNPNQRPATSRTLPTLGVLTLAVALIIDYWYYLNCYLKAIQPNPEGMVNLWNLYISYLTDPQKIITVWQNVLFGSDLAGSSIYLKYLLIPIFVMPFVYMVQILIRRKYPDFVLLWTNWPYMIYTIIWTVFGGTVNAIAQVENLYWNPAYNAPGTFDIGTHWITGTIFYAWLLCFAWAQYFHIDRFHPRFASFFDELFSLTIVLGINLHFEYIESLDPSRYFNMIGNSMSDIVAGVIFALAFASWIYSLLVPQEIGGYT
jgi:hypothetical protein